MSLAHDTVAPDSIEKVLSVTLDVGVTTEYEFFTKCSFKPIKG